MAKFFNPYHFVPLRAPLASDNLPLTEFPHGNIRNIRHDQYVPGTHSGRIVCRLKTLSPLVVGGQQDDGAPTEVKPYRLRGQVAIPASSLRGMISSISEAVSNSAPRVLEDRMLSFRKPMDKSLSAIGMVIAGKYLIPLTLPTLRKQGQDWAIPREFLGLYDHAAVRVYVGDFNSIRDEAKFPYRTFRLDGSPFQKLYGMRLRRRALPANGVLADDDRLHSRNVFLVSQLAEDATPRLWSEIPESQRTNYTRGIVRVLGCWGRGEEIPDNKIHELFLPIPQAFESTPSGYLKVPPKLNVFRHLLEIPADVVERFEQLSDQRTQEDEALPFEPRDTNRNRDPKAGRNFRLKDGDLVYFDVEERGGSKTVGELALSSIWRGRVETGVPGSPRKAATTQTFYQGIDPDLAPMRRDPAHEPRRNITLAEQLFGFVEDISKQKEPEARALAGRVRFSAAELAETPQDPDSVLTPPVTLKILSSPKPPSPALYFRNATGPSAYIPKTGLSPRTHSPQGRKFYLHARKVEIGQQTYGSRILRDQGNYKASLDQKVSVRPIREGTEFWFHIDFDNLSDRELGLLLYSMYPEPEFRHKLGMGKSLGLGSIHVEPMSLLLIERQQRYSDRGWTAARYHRAWLAPIGTNGPDAYRDERAIQQSGNLDPERDFIAAFRRTVNPQVHRALCLIGNPLTTQSHPVHMPLTTNQVSSADPKRREHETFSWFGQNDDRRNQQHQFLTPLDAQKAEDIGLEPLETN